MHTVCSINGNWTQVEACIPVLTTTEIMTLEGSTTLEMTADNIFATTADDSYSTIDMQQTTLNWSHTSLKGSQTSTDGSQPSMYGSQSSMDGSQTLNGGHVTLTTSNVDPITSDTSRAITLGATVNYTVSDIADTDSLPTSTASIVPRGSNWNTVVSSGVTIPDGIALTEEDVKNAPDSTGTAVQKTESEKALERTTPSATYLDVTGGEWAIKFNAKFFLLLVNGDGSNLVLIIAE